MHALVGRSVLQLLSSEMADRKATIKKHFLRVGILAMKSA